MNSPKLNDQVYVETREVYLAVEFENLLRSLFNHAVIITVPTNERKSEPECRTNRFKYEYSLYLAEGVIAFAKQMYQL